MAVAMWLVPCHTGPDVFAMRKPCLDLPQDVSGDISRL